jgi:hypothetical protein
MPLALAADTSAPLLVDWTLQNSNADISTSSRTVSVKFILSDDSKISEPKLLVKSLETTQMSSFALVKEIAKSGKLVSYEATVTINLGQSPREWEWVLYPLTDEFGNSNNSFGPGSVWPVKFRVFDKSYSFANFQYIGICLNQLRVFNKSFENYLRAKKSDPNNVRLSVLILKFNLPEININEKLCETDTERTLQNYGLDQAVALDNDLGPIFDEIQIKNQKTAAELKAKQEADAKVAAELKAKQDAQAKAAALKKSTITCIKGKVTKKVTAVKPKCPTGYKLKK